jgi:hypothetical protein
MGLALDYSCSICGTAVASPVAWCNPCFRKLGMDRQEAFFCKRSDYWIRKKWRKEDDRRI